MNNLFKLLWTYKWWWLAPITLMAIVFALLLYLTNATDDSPFIYTVF